MSKHVIILGGANGNELSKEQKKFNSLIKKIRKLKDKTVLQKEEISWFYAETDRIVRPAIVELNQLKREILRALHVSPARKKLTRNQKDALATIMVDWAEAIKEGDDDQEMADLIAFYTDDSEPTPITAAELEEVNQMAAMMGVKLDISIEEIERDGIEAVLAKIAAAQATFAQEQEEKRQQLPPKKPRKKTPKQQEKEQKLAEAAKKLNQTTKKVYFDLVRNFHPDQEQDPEKREEKTRLMQEINAAYTANDFLKLLELQITLLSDTAMAGTSDEELTYFNILLSEQVGALEYELFVNTPNPWSNPFFRLYTLGDKTRTQRALKKYAADIRKSIKRMKTEIMFFTDPKYVKSFVELHERQNYF